MTFKNSFDCPLKSPLAIKPLIAVIGKLFRGAHGDQSIWLLCALLHFPEDARMYWLCLLPGIVREPSKATFVDWDKLTGLIALQNYKTATIL